MNTSTDTPSPDPARTMGATDGACENTDVELWRERPGDYYADSIHVTKRGGIGINCGGTVYVMPLRKWHEAVQRAIAAEASLRQEREARAVLEGLLQVAKCPNCDGGGAIQHGTPDNFELEQCQWCFERGAILDGCERIAALSAKE